ncbi:MAG: peptidylprolyl isomerase [Actinomycetota bacterium]
MSKSQKLSSTAQSRLQAFQAKQDLEAQKAGRRTRDNRFSLIVAAGAIVVAILAQLVYFSFGPGSIDPAAEQPENSELVPAIDIAEGRTWQGSMEINGEAIELELDGDKAPQAVANFISLAKDGYFDGLSCHRLTTAGIYVLQCGDPNGDGTGGPGYSFGPIENAPADDMYLRGYLAMARQGGDGASMGSQFFIVYEDSMIPSDAAGGYTVFGRITKGLKKLAPIIEAGVAGGASDGAPALEAKLGAIELR